MYLTFAEKQQVFANVKRNPVKLMANAQALQ